MPKRTQIDGPATQEQISEALKTHNKAHEQRRLIAILMATLGIFTREQIGQAINQGRALTNLQYHNALETRFHRTLNQI